MKTKNISFMVCIALFLSPFLFFQQVNDAHAVAASQFCHVINGELVCTDVTPPPTCDVNNWQPDPSTVCNGQAFYQYNDCGTSRQALGTKTCTITPVCTFTPSNTATLQNGLVSQWLNNGTSSSCASQFATLMQTKGVIDPLFSLTATFTNMVQSLGLPVTTIWNMAYPHGNIYEQLTSKLQGYVCQLNTKPGVDISTVLESYHLSGNPFHLSTACSGGSPVDTTPPTVAVSIISQTFSNYTIQLIPHDNVGIADASYNIGSAASETSPASQHFTTVKQITVPKSATVTIYWWAKDTSGNEGTGNSALEGNPTRPRCSTVCSSSPCHALPPNPCDPIVTCELVCY